MTDNIGLFRITITDNSFIEGSRPGDFVITTTKSSGNLVIAPSNCTMPLVITSSNGMGVGTATPTAAFDVAGDVSVRSNIRVGGDIVPISDALRNIGTSNLRFKAAWVDTLTTDTIFMDGIPIVGKEFGETVFRAGGSNENIAIKSMGLGQTKVHSDNGLSVTSCNVLAIEASRGLTLRSQTLNKDVNIQSSGNVILNALNNVDFSAPRSRFSGAMMEVTGNVTIGGNLVVNGTQFVTNAQTVEIKDNIFLLNKGELGNGVTAGTAGLEIDRGGRSNARLIWAESNDTFNIGLMGQEQAIATQPWVEGAFVPLTLNASISQSGIVQLADSVVSDSVVEAATANAVRIAFEKAAGASNLATKEATTSSFGIVRLNNNVMSDNKTDAATIDTVRLAYEAAIVAQDCANSKWTAVNASTGQRGIVQLVDSVASDSIVEAGTANAVKVAYEKAVSASNLATTRATASSYGIVRLNNTVMSVSDTDVATANTVRVAFDAARVAQSTADGKWTAVNATTSNAGIVRLVDSVTSESVSEAATASAVKKAYDRAVQGGSWHYTGCNVFVGPGSNVGIGTTMSQYKLDVMGNVRMDALCVPRLKAPGLVKVSPADAERAVSTWTIRTPASDTNWSSICWSPDLALFVAVATSSGTGNRVMTSPDGVRWVDAPTSVINNEWRSVCWSPELSLFVAVASTGTGNRVMTSPDGIGWTPRASADNNDWMSVCWSPDLSLFVAVASTGTGNRVMTSPDGINWTRQVSAGDNDWRSVCWSPELSLFVAVAMSGVNRVMTSGDGKVWSAADVGGNSWMSVCWSPDLSLFVAVAISGVNRVMTSGDGKVWTGGSGTGAAAENSWNTVCWSPDLGLFVAVASTGTGNRVMTSPDGKRWAVKMSVSDSNWRSVCWSPELSMFVAVADGGRVMTASKSVTGMSGMSIGIYGTTCVPKLKAARVPTVSSAEAERAVSTWAVRTSAAEHNWSSVCWSPELSLFVAVASSGSTIYGVLTSPDGITFTLRVAAATNTWSSVCWSPERALFVAVASASNGTGNDKVMVSSNGITWSLSEPVIDNEWRSVCWSPELSLFVAVASSGVGNRVMTSPDGVKWTARTSAADNYWTSVCWSPELSLFVAVAQTATSGGLVMTSRDGITWTSRTSASSNYWYSVCWSPELSLFVAVSRTGSMNRVMTSPDGKRWTSRASAVENDWRSVCWSPDLSLFVAVAWSGAGNRVMTSPDGVVWKVRASPVDNNWNCVCWSPDLSLFVAVSTSVTTEKVMTAGLSKAVGRDLFVNGKLGLGTSAPSYQLQLSTDSAAKPTTSTWTTVSDERLKTDIEVADYAQCYDIVRRLDLKRFTWAESNVPELARAEITDKSKLGWVAQDVAPIFPKAITVVPEQYGLSNVLNVNFDQVYAAMYGAIRHLQDMVEELRAGVAPMPKIF